MRHVIRTSQSAICPICHETRYISFYIEINDNEKDLIICEEFEIPGSLTGIDLLKHCQHCGNDVDMILVENKMAKVISLLNSKGYETVCCCEGHMEGNYVSLPYISFKQNVPCNIFMSLPDGWYVDIDSLETPEDGEPQIAMYYRDLVFPNIDIIDVRDINFDECELIDWVKNL